MAGQVLFEFNGVDKVTPVINRIRGASAKLEQSFRGATTKIRGSFANLQKSATGLAPVLASLGAAAVVKGLADAGVEADRTAKRIKFLGDQFGEAAKLQGFAQEAAKKFTLGQTNAAKAVADLFGRLRPMGVSLDDIKSTFNGVNVAARQMNLTAADTEGVMLQLSQALGSGKLQGDEFRSVMERLPKIGQAVAKSMGVTVGQLKELSSQGKLTTDVLIKALKDIEKQGFPEADGVRQFNKAMKDLSTTVGKRLTPILDPILKGIASLVNKFLELPEPVQAAVIGFGAIATAFGIIVPLLPAIAAGIGAIIAVVTGPVGLVAAIGGAVAGFLAMRDSAKEAKEPVKEVAEETEKVKAAAEAAAAAKKELIEASKQTVLSLQEELSQVQQLESAFDNQLKITDARLSAETEINKLQGMILEQEYKQAGSAKERLGIAKEIFINEIKGAQIAYQQAVNAIEAEKQKLEFKLQSAKIEAKLIQAKGELAAAEADSAEKAQLILEKTKQAVSAQRDNIKMIEGQIDAQAEVAKHQLKGARAVLDQNILVAEQNAKQKLVSKEVGLTNKQADILLRNIRNAHTPTTNLAKGTDRVKQHAKGASHMYIRVANSATQAANRINAAASAQERFNRAKGGSKGGGSSAGGSRQAAGGYNLGSFKAFARGGVVKGPTLGMIGEGGEPEYIIPASKAAGFAANYISGKRGAGAIPGFAEGGYVGPVNINTGPVMQQDGTNYVTMDQFTQGIQTMMKYVKSSTRSYGARRFGGIV